MGYSVIDDILEAPIRDLADFKQHNVLKPTFTLKEEFQYSLQSSELQRGHAIMHHLRLALDSFDTVEVYRTKHQRAIQSLMMASLAVLVYGRAINNYEVEILDYNGFADLRQLLFLCMPRRGGKTEAFLQMACAVLMNIPNVVIRCISSNFRTAGGDSGLIAGIKRILKDHFKWTKFDKINEEVIIITINGTERKFHSHPGGSPDK